MAELKDLETRGKELAERVGQEIKKVRGEIAAGGQATSADKVSYNGKTVQEALDDLNYMPIQITSFTNTVNVVEMGATVDTVTLKFAFNKKPKSLTLDGQQEDVNATTKELTGLGITALQQIAQGHVKFDESQSLNDEQKKQARANIGALSAAVEKSGVALDTLTEEGSYVVTGATGLPADFTADPVFVTVTKAGTATVQMVGGVQGAEYKLFARTAADGAYGEFAQIGAKTDLTDYAKKPEVTAEIEAAVNPVKTTAEAAKTKSNENAGKITALEATVGEHTTKLTSLESQVQTNTTAIQKNAGDITTINANIGAKQDFVAAFEAALA